MEFRSFNPRLLPSIISIIFSWIYKPRISLTTISRDFNLRLINFLL